MSADPSNSQQKQREFLALLPLTIEIAGMPRAEVTKLFTEGQMEARILSLKTAYKLARQLMLEVSTT
ncbi:MAG: hypothetical protein ACJ8C4_02980 [Gemmataceae bacterium]